MFIVNEETGDITLIQGDSGEYTLNDLPTDVDDYVIFFQAQKDRVDIGEPISVQCLGESTVTFKFNAQYTDIFDVDEENKSEKYTFAFKICSESLDIEDTLILGNKAIGQDNIMTVYPKKVEGN